MTTPHAHDSPQLPTTAAEGYRARRDALLAAEDELERELDDLQAQAEPDPAQLLATLRGLLTTLQEHIEGADAPDGLLSQVIEDAPWLGARAEHVRRDHHDLATRARRLVDRVEAGDPVEVLLVDTWDLAAAVSHHRHRAAALLLDTYMSDIPAGD